MKNLYAAGGRDLTGRRTPPALHRTPPDLNELFLIPRDSV